jgi:hypothetical protein
VLLTQSDDSSRRKYEQPAIWCKAYSTLADAKIAAQAQCDEAQDTGDEEHVEIEWETDDETGDLCAHPVSDWRYLQINRCTLPR